MGYLPKAKGLRCFNTKGTILYVLMCASLTFICMLYMYVYKENPDGFHHELKMNKDGIHQEQNMTHAEGRTSVKITTNPDDQKTRYAALAMLRKSFPVTADFPTESKQPPKIPHIIHQTHWATKIPKDEVEYVRSVIKYNPYWKYYFWTDDIARKLIRDRHPSFLPTWDSYDKGIKRGDALRYFVLHEFGGVYMDLDFVVYRSLDGVTGKYSCIVPPEPLEQGLHIYKIPVVLNNGIMLCRPKHPFFKHMIENLGSRKAANIFVTAATGPAFITDAFFSYIQNVSGNGLHDLVAEHHGITFDKNNDNTDSDIHIANTVYFNDEIGGKKNQGVYQKACSTKDKNEYMAIACNEIVSRGLDRKGIPKNISAVQDGNNYYDYFCTKGLHSPIFHLKCDEVFRSGLLRTPGKYTFTSHKFYHSWCNENIVKRKPNVYIGDIVPHVILYS